MPTPRPVTDRSIRLAVVGLGQISELVLPTYAARGDIDVVGLCDLDSARVERWAQVWPEAARATALDDLLGIEADVVDVLVPIPEHANVATEILDAGYHVQIQKPLARHLSEADRMLAAAERSGAMLRVMEDYLFYPPLVRLREVVRSGEVGEPAGLHMKIVANGRGGWEVPSSSLEWQLTQAAESGGLLAFDHGWHQFAVAMWLFGPIRRVFGWIGETEIVPGFAIDAPATLAWEHEGGVRGVLDITFAPDMYFRSDYYTGDERVEVTGTKGYVRCNRISAFGVQEPSVVVYREGETRAHHALDDRPPAAFAASTAHLVDWFRSRAEEPVMAGRVGREVLEAVLAVLESSARNVPLDVPATPPGLAR